MTLRNIDLTDVFPEEDPLHGVPMEGVFLFRREYMGQVREGRDTLAFFLYVYKIPQKHARALANGEAVEVQMANGPMRVTATPVEPEQEEQEEQEEEAEGAQPIVASDWASGGPVTQLDGSRISTERIMIPAADLIVGTVRASRIREEEDSRERTRDARVSPYQVEVSLNVDAPTISGRMRDAINRTMREQVGRITREQVNSAWEQRPDSRPREGHAPSQADEVQQEPPAEQRRRRRGQRLLDNRHANEPCSMFGIDDEDMSMDELKAALRYAAAIARQQARHRGY